MQAAPDLAAALAAVRGIQARCATASDDELLADARLIEQLGRLVDAHRIAVAAEVEARSAKALGERSLAFRSGARDGVALVAEIARIDHGTAKRRVGIGAALAPATSLAGDELPSRYPCLTLAVRDGVVGIDSARVIVHSARAIQRRVHPDAIGTMVAALTEAAAGVATEVLRDVAATWQLALDPDGAEPSEQQQRRKRALRLGRVREDGTSMMNVVLTAEHRALIMELLGSRRRGVPLLRSEAGGDADGTCEGIDPEWHAAAMPDGTFRPRPQQDYDSLLEVIGAGLQAEHDGRAATSALHEVVVQVTASELEAREGAGWTPGVLTGLPIPVVERMICSGGTRLLVTDDDGEALYLSTTRRVFSPAQKKALVVAAGGRCQFPGCTAPAPFLEAHHVRWFGRDEGPTDIDNGVMLCSYHHHLIHAVSSPVELVRFDGGTYLVPSGFSGAPAPEQRVQRGQITDPRAWAARARRRGFRSAAARGFRAPPPGPVPAAGRRSNRFTASGMTVQRWEWQDGPGGPD